MGLYDGVLQLVKRPAHPLLGIGHEAGHRGRVGCELAETRLRRLGRDLTKQSMAIKSCRHYHLAATDGDSLAESSILVE